MSDIVERLRKAAAQEARTAPTLYPGTDYARIRQEETLYAEAATTIATLRRALVDCETIMTIVEPRSHKAGYLAALRQARAALGNSTEGK